MIHKKYPFVKQRDAKGCGVACLSMIIQYYHGYIGEDILYDMTSTSKKGTSAYHLVQVARTIGMEAKGIKCNVECMKDCTSPCIAHVLIEGKYGHYVVIYRIDWKKKQMYIADPARGKRRMSIQEFEKMFTGVIITLIPEKPLPLYTNHITLKKYMKSLLSIYKKEWLKIWIESILCLGLSILVSCSFAIMLQGVTIKSNVWISYTILLFICFGVMKNTVTYVQEKMVSKLYHKIDVRLMLEAIKNIIFLPYQFYCNRSTGEIVSRIQDLEKVGYEISQIMVLIGIDSMVSLTSSFILYSLSPILWKWTILWIGIYILIAYSFRKFVKNNVEEIKQLNASIYNDMIESIKGFETIKGLQLENQTVQMLSKKYIHNNQKLYELRKLERRQRLFKNIVGDIGYICICGLGCIQVIKGNLQLSEVIACQSLITYFLSPIEHILEMNVSICDMEKSLQRAIELVYQESEVGTLSCKKINKIEVKNLTYEKENTIIENISLQFDAHEKILLMGSSGSGKSTLLKIIRGYYPIGNNHVYINDIDLNMYKKESIGSRITYISQNEMIFTDTIYNNITLHRNCNENEVIKQIHLSHIDAITKNKMLGLQTVIEEDGYNVSGGERQRLILARSLLKKSDVILIDEGFSQMDHDLERNILKKLFKIYSKKMIVVVSHRKDNIDLFDTYIELQNGKIHTYLSKS